MASDAFWIGPARSEDTEAIHDLVFQNPDQFLRRISFETLKGRIAAGVCWVARRGGAGREIVAACVITVPETSPGKPPEPAEFGGLYVHEQLRGSGLGTSLATFAVASYFWDNDAENSAPLPLIAHVHVKNQKPRRILGKLQFVQKPGVIEVPDGIEGFEHMPKNAAGNVEGHEFEYPAAKRPDLFRWAAMVLETRTLTKGEPVEFDCPIGMTAAELRRLAAALDSAPR
ncbi:MAG: GNAT family N-acetyltransferase [Deltaproteobacteria bacterium]|nr:GNAT family N-acetyltransferase [Deltaproteobacteria bacterium]